MCVHVAICRHPILIFIPHIIRHAHIIYIRIVAARPHIGFYPSAAAPQDAVIRKSDMQNQYFWCAYVCCFCVDRKPLRVERAYIYICAVIVGA